MFVFDGSYMSVKILDPKNLVMFECMQPCVSRMVFKDYYTQLNFIVLSLAFFIGCGDP